MNHRKLLVSAISSVALLALPAAAQDWGNYGGNGARNGRSAVAGPSSANLLWSNTTDFSIISWHPFVSDGRAFTVRESGFPANGGNANDALVAYDVYTGAELWRKTMSFGGDTGTEWIAWIGGVRDGKVYASRSSNLQPQPFKAFDTSSGALLWTSSVSTEAWCSRTMETLSSVTDSA
jgi:outer membrane protein assembly factor BamB